MADLYRALYASSQASLDLATIEAANVRLGQISLAGVQTTGQGAAVSTVWPVFAPNC